MMPFCMRPRPAVKLFFVHSAHSVHFGSMSQNIKFVLNQPRNPKNIGASARGMANFGFRHLAVVNPYAAAWRETQAAVNAAPVVKRARKFKTLKEAIRSCHTVIGTSAGSRRNLSAQWIGLEALREIVHTARQANKRIAIVFGSERSGLSNQDLAYCQYVLRLPTVKDCPSMNLAQAVAVTACAIRANGDSATAAQIRPSEISVEHRERLVARALEACIRAGLLKGWDDRRSEDRLRKAFTRWNLTEVDIAMLHGVFGWMIKAASKPRR